MMALSDHLVILPILLPLAAAAAMLLLKESRIHLKRAISLGVVLLLVANAFLLIAGSEAPGATAIPKVYLVGDWAAPFGIVLVADRLAAVMLALTAVLGLAALLYATARWDAAGPRFHALFLLQLMGLNGAFLTGDLFNLFVFFEVLLAASYGLLLHGSGSARVTTGLHYIAINVAASLLFLIGASLIYGASGTLNLADLAARAGGLIGAERTLFQAGMSILGIAFLLKAGMWPLGFWLPRTYAAAAPPVAALFAILSKVGVYALLRVYLLLYSGGSAAVPDSAGQLLLYGGMATMLFGTIGVLACRTLWKLAGASVFISSGTLLAVIGSGEGSVLGAVLFYLVSSTLALSALYLLVELLDRQEAAADPQAEPIFEDEYAWSDVAGQEDEVGIVIPGTLAILGGAFMFCALLLAGLPPLSGFLGKFALIHGLLGLSEEVPGTVWALIALLIGSGLATLIAASRAGLDLIWTPSDNPQPVLRLNEATPVALLLAVCLGLTVFAGPVMAYMERTGSALGDRQAYVDAVMGAVSGRSR